MPVLYIGEEMGRGGSKVDIAVDPLEGTTLCAKYLPGALSVLAVAERGGLLHAPGIYMEKIAIGPGYEAGIVSLDYTVADNLHRLAEAKGVLDPRDHRLRAGPATACQIDRGNPRRRAPRSPHRRRRYCRCDPDLRAGGNRHRHLYWAPAARRKGCLLRRRCAASAAKSKAGLWR